MRARIEELEARLAQYEGLGASAGVGATTTTTTTTKTRGGVSTTTATTEESASRQRIVDAFRSQDTDGDGLICQQELSAMLTKLGVPPEDVPRIFASVDRNHDNMVDYEEFVEWVFGSPELLDAVEGCGVVDEAGPPQGYGRTDEERRQVLVYGRDGDAKTEKLLKALAKAGVRYATRDFDSDNGYEDALPEGARPQPPVACYGDQAWWDDPEAAGAEGDMFAGQFSFADSCAMDLRHVLGACGGGEGRAAAPVRLDASIDEEIEERFHSMQQAFLKVDENGDGRITRKELLQKCEQWNIPASEAERILGEADLDHNGSLDFNEFAKRFNSAAPRRPQRRH